jgi:hypothetical protein
MTRFVHSWLRAVAGATPARRRSFVPRLLLLEDRTLPSVQFTPAPYAVPANRPDTPLTRILGTSGSPVEPYISVNPADPGELAVSSQYGIRTSTTAGGSFTGATRFGVTAAGDTATTYDSAGRLFWVNGTNQGGLTGISIAQVDPNNGGILNTHVVDQVPDNTFIDDKEWLATDPSNNNLYVIWTRLRPGGNSQVLMRYSSDQGVSWSDPVQVDNGSDNYAEFSTVSIAPDHRVYAAYHSVSCPNESNCGTLLSGPNHDGKIVVVRFNYDLTAPVRSIAEVPGRADITFNIQKDDFARRIPDAQAFTAGSMQPWVLADPVRPGNIYVISADSNNGFHQDYGDIRLARSTDYGVTWSSSLIETSSALFPNAAIDQNGDIVLAWYDNRRGLYNSTGHFKLDVYATYSTDGGLTFTPAFPVNDQTPGVNTPNGNVLDPDIGAAVKNAGPPKTTWIGEYFGIALYDGTAYVAWNGNVFAGFNNPVSQQVWTKAFAIRGSLTVTGTDGSDNVAIRSIADNPAFVEVIVNGQRQYAGLWSALTSITVNATAGDDLVEVDNTAAGTPVTVNLGNGSDLVVISPTAEDLGTIQGLVTVHGGSGTGSVAIRDDYNAADTVYAITGTSIARTGSAGITYDHVTRLPFFGGSGNDTFNVLGALPSQLTLTAASLSANTLNIDDDASTVDTTYTMTNSSIARTGSAVLSYGGNITNLALTGGSGNNTYSVASTLATYPTTLNTGSGIDTVNVLGTAGPLFINRGSGGDSITLRNAAASLGGIGHVIVNDPSNSATVTVDDSGFIESTTYTITSTQVTAATWPNFLLSYNNLASLNLNGSSGNDSFAIESTASTTATTITAGSGSNRFDLTHTDQYLADLAGPLNLLGGGADTLVFWDTANPNAETYTFDNIPSMLALATVPTFATSWSGMEAVYLETNGMSTVNDPSGTVLVDVPPPRSAPNTAQELPRLPFRAVDDDSLVRAWLAADPQRPSMSPDVLAADLRHPWAQKPKEEPDLLVWSALDG